MAAVNYTSARFSAEDDNGRPLVGGRLFTYQNGTTTPAPTYRDQAGTILNTNPVILDARGEAVVYLPGDQLYTFVLQNRFGSLVWTQDGISGVTSSVDFSAFKGDLATDAGELIGRQQDSQSPTLDLQELFDVTMPTYALFGAKGDGVTNDTGAVNRAHAAGVYRGLPGSTYLVEPLNDITPPDYTTVDMRNTSLLAVPDSVGNGSLLRILGTGLVIHAPTIHGNMMECTVGTDGQLLVILGTGHRVYDVNLMYSPGRGFITDGLSDTTFFNFSAWRCGGLGAELASTPLIRFEGLKLIQNGAGFKKWKKSEGDVDHEFAAFGMAIRFRSTVWINNPIVRMNGKDGICVNQGSRCEIQGFGDISGNDDGGFTIAADSTQPGRPGDGEASTGICGPGIVTRNNYSSGVAAYQSTPQSSIRGRHYNNGRSVGHVTQDTSTYCGIYVAGLSSDFEIDADVTDDRPMFRIDDVNVSGSNLTIAAAGWVSDYLNYPTVVIYDADMGFKGYATLLNNTPTMKASNLYPVNIGQVAPGWFISQRTQHTGCLIDGGSTGSVSLRGHGESVGAVAPLQGRRLFVSPYENGQNVRLADAVMAADELLVNPSFDIDVTTGIGASTPGGGLVERHTGINKISISSMRIQAGTADATVDFGLTADITRLQGRFVQIVFKGKATKPNTLRLISISIIGGNRITEVVHPGGGRWHDMAISLYVPPECTLVLPRIIVAANTEAFIDENSFRVVTLP